MQIPPRLKKAVNYESNPISFGKPKETGLCLKRKVLYPCCLLPQTLSPWRGLKRSTERTVIPILHRRRSGSATVFNLPFLPGCFFSKKDFRKSRSKFRPVLKKQLIMNPTPFLLGNRKKRKRALLKEALRNLLHLLHFIFYRPFCQATVLLKNKSAQKQTQEKRLYKK
ncbi:MAG: hypothetical protein IJB66_04150 [Oscillospiraceae bacterium]|nr:hypothetical protein [Oscillospiraceae bacterium]